MIIEEVKDRFGDPPKVFDRLLDIAYLKACAHRAYISDVKYVADEARFIIWPDAPVHAERMDMLLKRYGGKLRFVNGKQAGFHIKVSKTNQDELLAFCEKVIEDIKLLTATDRKEEK